MFEEGANQHRTNMLSALSQRECDNAEALAIVGHLLYEGLLFHHKHFTVAISGLAKRGLWRAARSLLTEMRDRDLEPNTISYNAAADACKKAKAWQQAVDLVDNMREHAAAADVVSYSIVVTACEKASQWAGALAFFSQMQKAGLHPDQQSISAAIGACTRGQSWQAALTLLGESRAGSERPDLVCHNGVVSVCAKAQQWSQAVALLAGLQANGPAPDVISYNSTISACQAAHRWQDALGVFRDMQTLTVQPTIVTYNTLIHACWRAGGFWEGALSLLGGLRAQSLTPTIKTYGALLAALTPHARWVEALSLLGGLEDDGLSLDSMGWGTLVALLYASGELEHAKKAYRLAQDAKLLTPWAKRERGGIDLHGHVVLTALTALHVVLEDMLMRPAGRYFHDPSRDLLLILGRGTNSVGRRPILAPQLTTLLRKDFDPPLDLVPATGNFTAPTSTRVARGDLDGAWVIPSGHLVRWAAANSPGDTRRSIAGATSADLNR